jgi:flagellar hook-basal body complex protein FliE
MLKPVTVNTVELPTQVPTRIDKAQSPTGEAFTDTLKTAVAKIDEIQVASDVEASKLAGGEGNLHETMLALEKADVAMKVALKVRNKVIDAYNDVMRMSV